MTYLVKELTYVPRSALTDDDIARLTVDKINYFGTKKGDYTLLRYAGDRVGVPRYYFKLDPYPLVRGKWEMVNIPFNGVLRPYQREAIIQYMKALKKFPYGGIIQMPTGSGKTVVGIALSSLLKLRTMVVVHTEVIRDQWLESIRKFTGQEPGLIQQSVRDIQPITVAMIQTLLSAKIPKETFGHVIYDEVHIMGAEKFSETAPKFNPKIRTGLSATPYRKDGKTYIFKWHIGPVLYKRSKSMVDVQIIKIRYADPKTSGRGCYVGGKFIRSNYNKKLNIPRRNRLIASLADRAVKKGYKVLILSDSLQLLHAYSRLINHPIRWIIGRRKDKNEGQPVILGTYQAAGIGFDDADINCVIFATPRADVHQAMGRLSRYEGDKPVIVFDIVDVLCRQSNIYWKAKKKKNYAPFRVIEKN